jgi:ribosome-binding factor A
MPREYPRHLRVAGELQRALNELLQVEVKDPRLTGVTVSAVELSGDLGVARVFFSMLDPDADPSPALVALEKATGFLRGRIGRTLRLRKSPELRFRHDDSASQGFALTHLIDQVASDEAGDASGDDDPDAVDGS